MEFNDKIIETYQWFPTLENTNIISIGNMSNNSINTLVPTAPNLDSNEPIKPGGGSDNN
jgi:hypothetical protein